MRRRRLAAVAALSSALLVPMAVTLPAAPAAADGFVSYKLLRCYSTKPKPGERSGTYMGSYRQTWVLSAGPFAGHAKPATSKWKGWSLRAHRAANGKSIQFIATRGTPGKGRFDVRTSRCFVDGIYIVSA